MSMNSSESKHRAHREDHNVYFVRELEGRTGFILSSALGSFPPKMTKSTRRAIHRGSKRAGINVTHAIPAVELGDGEIPLVMITPPNGMAENKFREAARGFVGREFHGVIAYPEDKIELVEGVEVTLQ